MSKGPDGPATVLDKLFRVLFLLVFFMAGLSMHSVNGINDSSSDSD